MLDKAHAAVAAGGNSFCYDQNGNMVRRVIGGVTYTLTYDAENHLTGYSGGSVNASFVYDGDGRRVRATVNGVTTTFVGNYVEWKNSVNDMVRYYYAGGVRLAMRSGADNLVWLVGDHLGSTSIAVNNSSGQTERQGYKAWGETRFGDLPTNYRYTGQYENGYINLYWYNSRWMDPELGRFTQADTIIPDNYHPLDWDRYSYVRNNPIRYQDPSGHKACDGENEDDCRAPFSGLTPEERLDSIASRYNVTFGGNWSLAYKRIILKAVMLVGAALASAAGVYMTAWGAFNAVYGSVHFLYENSGGVGGKYSGYQNGIHTITFSGLYRIGTIDYMTKNIRLAIHELGHAFDSAVGHARGGNQWTNGARTDMNMGVLGRDDYEDSDGGFWGFAGGHDQWQFSILDESFGSSGEVFADMFLGWVYGMWGGEPYGPDRQEHMDDWMDAYLGLFLTQ